MTQQMDGRCKANSSGLTQAMNKSKFLMMRFVRSILIGVVVFALAAYAVDCSAMSPSEEAMQCCNTMPCSHGHGQAEDCCRSMAAMHAPFVQASPIHGSTFSTVVLAIVPAFKDSPLAASFGGTVRQMEAKPTSGSPPVPLRI